MLLKKRVGSVRTDTDFRYRFKILQIIRVVDELHDRGNRKTCTRNAVSTILYLAGGFRDRILDT